MPTCRLQACTWRFRYQSRTTLKATTLAPSTPHTLPFIPTPGIDYAEENQKLEDGADFAELAREISTGPSGPNGGDLGYFGRGAMVPVFEEAAFNLEKNSFTLSPVQSQFGWHVIKLFEAAQLIHKIQCK